jgi:hypothetical protein
VATVLPVEAHRRHATRPTMSRHPMVSKPSDPLPLLDGEPGTSAGVVTRPEWSLPGPARADGGGFGERPPGRRVRTLAREEPCHRARRRAAGR